MLDRKFDSSLLKDSSSFSLYPHCGRWCLGRGCGIFCFRFFVRFGFQTSLKYFEVMVCYYYY